MVERLFEAIEALEFLPYRYKVHQVNKQPERVIRSMPVPPYVVYYRILETAGVVRILTVRHGARRKPRKFDKAIISTYSDIQPHPGSRGALGFRPWGGMAVEGVVRDSMSVVLIFCS
jgi:plasmid stabilization system protein ParE